MSRIGKNPVAVPDGVNVEIVGRLIKAKGKLGELSYEHADDIDVRLAEGNIHVAPKNETKRARFMWGTTRTCIVNLVTGVAEGFTVNLEINGVGYRAAVQGKVLNLQLGLSHDVNFPIPEGVTIKCDKQTNLAISGADKQLVGQVAANIRSYRKPEPYKGKGIKYANEIIFRKEGKKK